MKVFKRVNGFLLTALCFFIFLSPIQIMAETSFYTSITDVDAPDYFSLMTTIPVGTQENLVTSIQALPIDFNNKQIALYFATSSSKYYLSVRDNHISSTSNNYLADIGSKTAIAPTPGMVYRFNSDGTFDAQYRSSWGAQTLFLVYANGLFYAGSQHTPEETNRYCMTWETFVASNGQGTMVCTAMGDAIISSNIFRNYAYINYSFSPRISNAFGSIQLRMTMGINDVNQSVQNLDGSVQDVNQSVKDMDDTIKNEDISGASGSADSFFSGFETDFGGLTSIITAPLVLINSLTSQCEAINLPFGIVSGSLSLPCMGSIYTNYFGSLFSVYQMITDGMIAYWVVKSIFGWVQDFKNPESSKVEVVDL